MAQAVLTSALGKRDDLQAIAGSAGDRVCLDRIDEGLLADGHGPAVRRVDSGAPSVECGCADCHQDATLVTPLWYRGRVVAVFACDACSEGWRRRATFPCGR